MTSFLRLPSGALIDQDSVAMIDPLASGGAEVILYGGGVVTLSAQDAEALIAYTPIVDHETVAQWRSPLELRGGQIDISEEENAATWTT